MRQCKRTSEATRGHEPRRWVGEGGFLPGIPAFAKAPVDRPHTHRVSIGVR